MSDINKILFDMYIEELERTILIIEYELEWRREEANNTQV